MLYKTVANFSPLLKMMENSKKMFEVWHALPRNHTKEQKIDLKIWYF